MFGYYGGIDFSGAREPLGNLWTAVGREEGDGLRILDLRPHAFRADLGAYVAGGWRAALDAAADATVLWGADFPFGLPAAAVEAVVPPTVRGSRWQAVLAWVADRPPDEVRQALAEHQRLPRAADRGGAAPPLDLRLYKQTVEGLRWLHELLETAEPSVLPQAPKPGAGTTLVEVYPSGAAHELGLPRRRSPGRPGEVRARAVALRTYLEFADPSLEAAAVTLEDAWDATIACLTAWLCRADLEQAERVLGEPLRTALEGWIYTPPAALAATPAPGRRRS